MRRDRDFGGGEPRVKPRSITSTNEVMCYVRSVKMQKHTRSGADYMSICGGYLPSNQHTSLGVVLRPKGKLQTRELNPSKCICRIRTCTVSPKP